MVSSHQIMKGVAMWIDSEIASTMNGFPQYGIGMASALLSRRGEKLLNEAARNEAVQTLGIAQDGSFDLELLREIMLEPFPEDGLRLEADQINDFAGKFLGRLGPIMNFQVRGGVTFHRSDVEKLFEYIIGG